MFSENAWPIQKGRNGLPVWRLNKILAIIQDRIQTIPGENREVPLVWSVMHMYSTMQLAKLIALKRGLDSELAALTCAFHDIFTLQTGNHTDHAIKAERIIREIIEEYNKKHRESLQVITEKEISLIIKAVAIHSDKTTTTENPYEELLKDVDSIDSFLHGMTPGRTSGRIPRVNGIFEELNIKFKVIK